MSRQERKARAQALATDLQKSSTHEASAAKELVDLLFEEAKEALVTASGEETIRLQGEARAMERLYKKLTVSAPTAKQEH